jgi:DNA (cytosine-5)-methyltransferase 1
MEDDFNLVAPLDGKMQRGGCASDYPTGLVASLQGGGHSREPEPGSGIVVANTLRESDGHHGRSSPRGDGCDNLVSGTIGCRDKGRGPDASEAASNQLVAFDTTQITSRENGSNPQPGDPCHPLSESAHAPAIAYALRNDPGGTGQGHNTNYVSAPADADGVRDFAGLPKGLDSPRYRALGNAVTQTVAYWIAKRIVAFEFPATPCPLPPAPGVVS